MSKSRAKKSGRLGKERRQSRASRKLALVGMILFLGVAGVIFAQWRTARFSTRPSRSVSAVAIPLPSTTPALSKEYIYAGSKLVAIEAPKSDQTITFNTLADKTYGDAAFAVSASSSSGLTVGFSIVSGPASVSGTTVTITGVGTVTVRASQAGNSNYNSATDVDRSFNVAKASATITLGNLNQTYDGTAKSATATTSPVGLSGVAITYNNSTTAPTNAGGYSVAASLDNPNYSGTGTGTLVIAKATPSISWNNPADITYGTPLSSTQLNATAGFGASNLAGTFAYSPGAGTTLNVGNNQSLSNTFTPSDAANFNNASGSAHINVMPACGSANGFANTRTITIDHTKVPNTDQTNFPVLISGTYSYLATAANGGNVQNANGYDVIFTSDSGCATKLNHEVESYNATTGTVNYWVKLPTVSHTSNTSFYMCYGNAGITNNQANAEGVWDGSYKGVWHLPDGSNLNPNDSTANANHGTATSVTATTGQVDGAGSFNGNSSKISAGNPGTLDGFTAFTISAWIKLASLPSASRLVTKWGATSDRSWLLGTDTSTGTELVVGVEDSANQKISAWATTNAGLGTGAWYHVVATWSQPSAVNVYVNGTSKTMTTWVDQGVTHTGGSSQNVRMGAQDEDGLYGSWWNGTIDEVRISNIARSSDWIKTEYNNQLSPLTFYSISPPNGCTNYTFRRPVTIDHTRVPNTDQTNYPVLISGTYSYLATAANGGNVQNSNGYDVIFASDSGCATKLNHEVETYNAASGAVNYWVKVPTVSHTSDTTIYMCYGNPGVTTDQSNKTAVWDGNFKGVHHLPNGATLSANDSTANAANGAVENATATAGQISGGASFNGSSAGINLGNTSTWAMGSGDYTFEAWIKVTSNPAALGAILQKDAAGERQVALQFDNLFAANSINLIHFNDDGTFYWRQAPANSIAPNTWYHVAGVRSGSALSIYINGVSQTLSNPYSNGPLGTMKSAASLAYIGRDAYSGYEDYFNGLIDEARVSNVARSADWIKTEYNNQSSPSSFVTIGSAQ